MQAALNSMVCVATVTTVLLWLALIPTGTRAVGVCTQTQYMQHYVSQAYYVSQSASQYYTVGCGWWGRRCGRYRTIYKQVLLYQSVSQPQSYIQQICCSGYSGSAPNCNPVCSAGCVNGDCTAPNTCVCNTGWTGTACNQDINECSTNNGGCAQNCHNTAGSYHCSCNTGYSLNGNGHSCNDINECNTNNGGCNQVCTNTIGSFECSCNIGYELSTNPLICVDTNECANNNGGCAQNCHNNVGSYTCSCNAGYTLNSNGHACNDVNECALNTHLCHHICINNVGSYTCDCNVGYMLNSDGLTCSDIDECATNNGGCDQNCHNTAGSYYCTCNTGFLLDDDGHGCSDHDECATAHDNCDQHCHNTHGSFYCTCDSGWILEMGHICTDIDECAQDISGCTQICNNTPGSYFCTCFIGYRLNSDNHSCSDINECDTKNGGCEHICTNSIGSYECSCRVGYDLAVNFHDCDGQPCVPQLTAPQNGSISCTGDQVTDQNCSFWCDAGFSFSGSELRECLSNNNWTGVDAVCTPKHCPVLENPANGYVLKNVLIECGTVLTTACEIRCVEEYFIDDTTPFYQTCVANQTSGGVYWTTPPVCERILPCHSEPCKHNGMCTNIGTDAYKCDCSGSLYTGDNCDRGIVRFSSTPVITTNRSAVVEITAHPDDAITVTLISSDNLDIMPGNVTIDKNNPNAQFEILSTEAGQFILTYAITGPSATDFDTSQSHMVLVVEQSSAHTQNMYFNEVGTDVGVLQPGCCTADTLTYQCSSSSAASFPSTCTWSSQDVMNYLSSGIVFVSGSTVQLPISIAGARISMSPDGVQNSLLAGPLACTECPSRDVASCYHYDFTPNDIFDFLQSRALAQTYLSRIQTFLPSWLSLMANSNSPTNTTSFSLLDYMTSLAVGQDVNHLKGCEGLNVANDGLYTVLRYYGSLTGQVQSVMREHMLTEEADPICFAVNLCHGHGAPVHISIPTVTADTISSLDQLQSLTSIGWQFTFREATTSNVHVPVWFNATQFWNGNAWFTMRNQDFDLRLETTVNSQLTSTHLWINYQSTGELFHQYQPQSEQVQGMMVGDHVILANMTIDNEIAAISLRGNVYPIVFSLSGYATTTIPGGACAKLFYTPALSDGFFSRVLPLPEDEASCLVDAFIKFNDTTNDLSWMSFITDCLDLRISDFLFPSSTTKHKVYLSGASAPPTMSHLYDGAVVRIYSDLKDDSLTLNQYLTVRQPATGPAISAGYWNKGRLSARSISTGYQSNRRFSARLHEAEFSLLGTQFTAPADIDEYYLTFSANVTIFGRYNTQISGRVPTGRPWDDTSFIISGDFDTSPFSFVNRVDEYTHNYVTVRVNQASERLSNAAAAKNSVQMKLTQVQESLNESTLAALDAVSQYQQALDKVAAANSIVASLQMEVDQASAEFHEAQNKLTKVCEEQQCTGECAPQIECHPCNNHLTSDVWSHCNITGQETMVDYRVVPTTVHRWGHRYQCRILTDIVGWAATEFVQECGYISTPKEVSVSEEETYLREVNVSHITSCVENSVDMSVSQVCCEKLQCGMNIPRVSCVAENVACQLAQLPALNALSATQQSLLEPLQQLSQAKANLTLALSEAAIAETNKNVTEYNLNAMVQLIQSLTTAATTQDNNYQQILTAEDSIQDLQSLLYNNSIDQLLNVVDLKFSVSFQDSSPRNIPVTVSVLLPELNKTINISLTTDLAAPEKIIQRDIAKQVLLQAGSMLVSKQINPVIQNQFDTNAKTLSLFERNNAAVSNLKSYLVQANTTLDSVVSHMMNSRLNVSAVANQIRLLGPLSSVNFTHINITLLQEEYGLLNIEEQIMQQALNSSLVVSLQHSINVVADETEMLVNGLDDNIFVNWQHAMDSINVVNGEMCFGFVDCLTIFCRITQELLEDTPGDHASELLDLLPAAKGALLDLALLTDLTPAQAKMKMSPIWDLLDRLESIGYWSSTPPVITQSPDPRINVNYGEELSMTVKAESQLPVSYSWKKNRYIQPDYTSSTLTIDRAMYSNEGKYQCSVSSEISTTDSLFSTVTVFEPPVITQSPTDFTTFEGDDNGAVFVCNATATPSPSYRWYWSPDREVWSSVSNSSSNKLIISKPKKESNGWYRCRAFTANGWVQSDTARLTILSASISKLVHSVSFQIELAETMESSGSGTKDNEELTTERLELAAIQTIVELIGVLSTARFTNFAFSYSEPTSSADVSFDVFNDFPYLLNHTLVDTALLARVHHVDLMTAVANLQGFLQNASYRLNVGAYRFAVKNSPRSISSLQYICPAGSVLRYNNFLCIGCAPGYYQGVVDGEKVCSVCAVGYYQTSDATTSCDQCPSGHTTVRSGSRTMDDCLAHCRPGYFNSTYGVEPCQPCPDRFYQLESGATSCLPCPERSTLRECFVPSPNATTIPTRESASGANIAVIISASVASALLIAIIVVVVVVVVLVVVRNANKKSLPRKPPPGYFPEPNTYGDTHQLINSTRSTHYSVAGSIQEDRVTISNPLYQQKEEEGHYDSIAELSASKATHKLEPVEEEEDEDMYESLNNITTI